MNLSKNAIGNLINRYKAVLKKCHLLNTFGSLALAGMLVGGTLGMGAGLAHAATASDLEPDSITIENETKNINALFNDPNATATKSTVNLGKLVIYGTGTKAPNALSTNANITVSGTSNNNGDLQLGQGRSVNLTFDGDITLNEYSTLKLLNKGNITFDGNIKLAANTSLTVTDANVVMNSGAITFVDDIISSIVVDGTDSSGSITLGDGSTNLIFNENSLIDLSKYKELTINGGLVIDAAEFMNGTGAGDFAVRDYADVNINGDLILTGGGDMTVHSSANIFVYGFDASTESVNFTAGTLNFVDDPDTSGVQTFKGDLALASADASLDVLGGTWGTADAEGASLSVNGGNLDVGDDSDLTSAQLNVQSFTYTDGTVSVYGADSFIAATEFSFGKAFILRRGAMALVGNGSDSTTPQTFANTGSFTLGSAENPANLNVNGGYWKTSGEIIVTSRGTLTVADGATFDVSGVTGGLVATDGSVVVNGSVVITGTALGDFTTTVGEFAVDASKIASNVLSGDGILTVTGLGDVSVGDELAYNALVNEVKTDLGFTNGTVVLAGVNYTIESLNGVNKGINVSTGSLMAGTLAYNAAPTIISHITENTQGIGGGNYSNSTITNGAQLTLAGHGSTSTLSAGSVRVEDGASLTLGYRADGVATGTFGFGGDITVEGEGSSLNVAHSNITINTGKSITLENGADLNVDDGGTLTVDALSIGQTGANTETLINITESGTLNVGDSLALTPMDKVNITEGSMTVKGIAMDKSQVNIGSAGTLTIDGSFGSAAVNISAAPGENKISIVDGGKLVITDNLTLNANSGKELNFGGSIQARGVGFDSDGITYSGGTISLVGDDDVGTGETFTGKVTVAGGTLNFTPGSTAVTETWGDTTGPITTTEFTLVSGTVSLAAGAIVDVASFVKSGGTLSMDATSLLSSQDFDFGGTQAEPTVLDKGTFVLRGTTGIQTFKGNIEINGATLQTNRVGTWGDGSANVTFDSGTMSIGVFNAVTMNLNTFKLNGTAGFTLGGSAAATINANTYSTESAALTMSHRESNIAAKSFTFGATGIHTLSQGTYTLEDNGTSGATEQTFGGSLTLNGFAATDAILNIAGGVWNAADSTVGNLNVGSGTVHGKGTLNLNTLTISNDAAAFGSLTSTAQINANTLTTTTALTGLKLGSGTVSTKALTLGGALTLAGGNLNLLGDVTTDNAAEILTVTGGKLTVGANTTLDVDAVAGGLVVTGGSIDIQATGEVVIDEADLGTFAAVGGGDGSFAIAPAEIIAAGLTGAGTLTVSGLSDVFTGGTALTESGYLELINDVEDAFTRFTGEVELAGLTYTVESLNGVNTSFVDTPGAPLMAGTLDYVRTNGSAIVISHIIENDQNIDGAANYSNSSVKNGAKLTLTGNGGSDVLSPGSVTVSEGATLTLGHDDTPFEEFTFNGDITVDGADFDTGTDTINASLVVDGMNVTLGTAAGTGANSVTLTNGADLTIDNDGELTIAGLTVGATAGSIDFTAGTLITIGVAGTNTLNISGDFSVKSTDFTLEGNADTGIILNNGNTLNVGGDFILTNTPKADFDIKGTIQAQGVSFGTNDSTITLGKGTVNLVGDTAGAGSKETFTGNVTIDGGKLSFDSIAVSETWGDGSANLTYTDGILEIGDNTTLHLKSFTLGDTAATNNTDVSIGAGSTVAAKAFDFAGGYTLGAATFTLVDDTTITDAQTFSGALNLNHANAKLNVGAGEWGTSDAAGADLTLTAGAVEVVDKGVLNLKSFTNKAASAVSVNMGAGTVAAASFDFGTSGFTLNQGVLKLADDNTDSIQTFTGNFTLQGAAVEVTLDTGSGVWGNDSAVLNLTNGTITGAGQLHVDTLSVGNGSTFKDFTGELNAKTLSTTGDPSTINLDKGTVFAENVALSDNETSLQGGTLTLVGDGNAGISEDMRGKLTLSGDNAKLNVQSGEWNVADNITVTNGALTIHSDATFDISDATLTATATSGTITNAGTLTLDDANLGSFDFNAASFTLGNSIGAANLTNSGKLIITGLNTQGTIEEIDYLNILADVRADLGNIGGEIVLSGIGYTIQSLSGVYETYTEPTKTLMAGTLDFAGTTTIAAITENTQTSTTVYDSTITGSGVNLVLTGLDTNTTLSEGDVEVLQGASLTLGDAATAGESFNFGGDITLDGADANGVASSLTVTSDFVTMANTTGTNFDVILKNGANFTVHNNATINMDSLVNDNKGIITVGNSATDASTLLINNALSIADVDNIVGGTAKATAGQIYLGAKSSLHVNDNVTFTNGGELLAGGGTLLAQGFSFGEATTLKGGSLTFMLDPNVASGSAQTFSGELTAEAGNITFSSGGTWGDGSANFAVDGTSKTQLGVGVRVNLDEFAVSVSTGTLAMGTGSTISAKSFDLGANTFTLTSQEFELVGNGSLAQGFNGSLILDGTNAELDVQGGTWVMGIGNGASAASLTLNKGTLNVVSDAHLDVSNADLTFGKDSTINLEDAAKLNVDIDVFGSVDLEKGSDMFTMNTDLGTLTATAGTTLNLVDNPEPYVSRDYFDDLTADVQAKFDALTGFEGTVSLDNAFEGFSDSLSEIDENVYAPTFSIGAGDYGADPDFTNNESTFAGIHGSTQSTVSKGTLNLTGDGVYNTDRVLSEGSITVNGGELNLGYDGTAATDGGVVQGGLTVTGSGSMANIYGMKGDASMGVTVTGDISIENGADLTVQGKLAVENVTVGGSIAAFYVNGETTVKELIIEDAGHTEIHTETFNAESVTVKSGGYFDVYANSVAYDSASGLGIDKFIVEAGGDVDVTLDETLSVNSASFAGDTIDFGFDPSGTEGGTLSANSVELKSATGTLITDATIETGKFDAAGTLTLGDANAAGNLYIVDNGNATAEWTAAKGEDVSIENGTLSLGLGAVVDLSDVTFTAGDGAVLESAIGTGSNLMVGLTAVGLDADGNDDGTATVIAQVLDDKGQISTAGADVSGLLGTVTIVGLNAMEVDAQDYKDSSSIYYNLIQQGQDSFGKQANIDYGTITFTNTENLTIDEVAQNSLPGLGKSEVSIDTNGSKVEAGQTAHVGSVKGAGDIEVEAGGELSISGLSEDGSGGEGTVLLEGSITGEGDVGLGNDQYRTKLNGSVEAKEDLSIENVDVDGNIKHESTAGTAELHNVTAKNVELNNTQGTKLSGDNEFKEVKLSGDQEIIQDGGSLTADSLTSDGNAGFKASGGAQIDVTKVDMQGADLNIGSVDDLTPAQASTDEASHGGGDVVLDPVFTDGKITSATHYAIGEFTGGEVDGRFSVGRNSYLVLGDASTDWAVQNFEKGGFSFKTSEPASTGVTSALFIRKAQTLDDDAATGGGIMVDGTITAATLAEATASGGTISEGDAVRVDSSGTVVAAPVAVNSATFAADSLLVVDASENGVGVDNTKAALTAGGSGNAGTLTIDATAKLHIVDGTSGVLKVVSGFSDATSSATLDSWAKDNVSVSSSVLEVTDITTNATDGSVNVTISADIDNAGYTLLQGETYSYLNNMLDDGIGLSRNSAHAGRRFLSLAMSDDVGLGVSNEKRSVATIEGAAQMGAAANAAAGTVAAGLAAGGAVGARNTGLVSKNEGGNTGSVTLNNGDVTADVGVSGGNMAEKSGLGVWLTPLYKWNTGTGFESGGLEHGYDMGLGGIALGVDFTNRIATDTALRFGLAFNVGAGYSDSTGDYNETNNDFNFWGLTAYGAFQKENFVATLDIGFTSSYNDVTQDLPTSMGMGDLSADIDSMAFSVGLNLEYTFNAGMMDITPHAGVRYMSVTTDEYEIESMYGRVATVEEDTQDIWYFPVGVTFSADIESANGWKFTPKLDLGFIAAAGDLEATSKTRFSGVPGTLELGLENIDGFAFNGGVGFELSSPEDGISIGLNYNLQAGSKDTGHMIFANFRYDF